MHMAHQGSLKRKHLADGDIESVLDIILTPPKRLKTVSGSEYNSALRTTLNKENVHRKISSLVTLHGNVPSKRNNVGQKLKRHANHKQKQPSNQSKSKRSAQSSLTLCYKPVSVTTTKKTLICKSPSATTCTDFRNTKSPKTPKSASKSLTMTFAELGEEEKDALVWETASPTSNNTRKIFKNKRNENRSTPSPSNRRSVRTPLFPHLSTKCASPIDPMLCRLEDELMSDGCVGSENESMIANPPTPQHLRSNGGNTPSTPLYASTSLLSSDSLGVDNQRVKDSPRYQKQSLLRKNSQNNMSSPSKSPKKQNRRNTSSPRKSPGKQHVTNTNNSGKSPKKQHRIDMGMIEKSESSRRSPRKLSVNTPDKTKSARKSPHKPDRIKSPGVFVDVSEYTKSPSKNYTNVRKSPRKNDIVSSGYNSSPMSGLGGSEDLFTETDSVTDEGGPVDSDVVCLTPLRRSTRKAAVETSENIKRFYRTFNQSSTSIFENSPQKSPKSPKSPAQSSPRNIFHPDQMIIDAGQKNLGATRCEGCGLLCNPGDPLDDATHARFHKDVINTLKFTAGCNSDKIVKTYIDNEARVLMVDSDARPFITKKVEDINKVMSHELGFSDSLLSLQADYKVFLYVCKRRIVGCCVAEPVTRGYKVISSESPSQSNDRAWLCESTPRKCSVGVGRIWVYCGSRRQGIATRLLDCMREHFVFGSVIDKCNVAFSDPTPDGMKLARNYIGSNFLVYKQ